MKTNSTNTPATMEEIQAVTAALKAAQARLTFVHRLKPEERRQHRALGSQTVRLTAKRLEAARGHRDTLPPLFDYGQFERETLELMALNDCMQVAEQIAQDLRDTMMSRGQSAVDAGRHAMVLMDVAAGSGSELGRTVSRLKRSRSRRGAAVSADTAAAPTEASSPSAPKSGSPPGPAPASNAEGRSPVDESNAA